MKRKNLPKFVVCCSKCHRVNLETHRLPTKDCPEYYAVSKRPLEESERDDWVCYECFTASLPEHVRGAWIERDGKLVKVPHLLERRQMLCGDGEAFDATESRRSRPRKISSDDTGDPAEAMEQSIAAAVAGGISADKARKQQQKRRQAQAKARRGERLQAKDYHAAGLTPPDDGMTDDQHRAWAMSLDNTQKIGLRRTIERERVESMTPDERLQAVSEDEFRRMVKSLTSKAIEKAKESGRKLTPEQREQLRQMAEVEITFKIMRMAENSPTMRENTACKVEGLRSIKEKSLMFGMTADGSKDKGENLMKSMIARTKATQRFEHVAKELRSYQNSIDPKTGQYRDLSAYPWLLRGCRDGKTVTHKVTHSERKCEREEFLRTPYCDVPEEKRAIQAIEQMQKLVSASH